MKLLVPLEDLRVHDEVGRASELHKALKTSILIGIRSEHYHIARLDRCQLDAANAIRRAIKEPVGVEDFHDLDKSPFKVDEVASVPHIEELVLKVPKWVLTRREYAVLRALIQT